MAKKKSKSQSSSPKNLQIKVPAPIFELWQEACLAQKDAVATYSGYRVGAALRSKTGKITRGVNVELIINGLSVCAERSALYGALSYGHRNFTDICVVVDNAEGASPCGACRQTLLDHCGLGLNVWIGSPKGIVTCYTLGELLPHSFSINDVSAVVSNS